MEDMAFKDFLELSVGQLQFYFRMRRGKSTAGTCSLHSKRFCSKEELPNDFPQTGCAKVGARDCRNAIFEKPVCHEQGLLIGVAQSQ